MIPAASWPAIQAEAAATARLIPPRFNQVPPRLFAGAVRGRGTGASVEFHDQRPWVPGDDPRRVHWAASARAGKPVLVEYREEARPSLDLILDCSASMLALPGRAERAAGLVAWLAAGARDLGASLRLILAHAHGHELHPAASLASGSWLAPARALSHGPGQGKGDRPTSSQSPRPSPAAPPAAPDLARLPLRPASQRVWISDLLFPANPETLLRPLLAREGRAQLLAPFHPDEIHPPWAGHCLLADPESAAERNLEAGPTLLQQYQTHYTNHFATWDNACRRHRIPLHRISSAGTLGEELGRETT